MLVGRSIRGLGLAVIVGATALAGCGSKREDSRSSQVTASTASAPLPSAALARAEGSVLAKSAAGFASNAKGRSILAAVVPERANHATRLSANGVHVELRAEGAADHAGEFDGGATRCSPTRTATHGRRSGTSSAACGAAVTGPTPAAARPAATPPTTTRSETRRCSAIRSGPARSRTTTWIASRASRAPTARARPTPTTPSAR